MAYGMPPDYTACGSRSFAVVPVFGFFIPETTLLNRLDIIAVILTAACAAAWLVSLLFQRLLRTRQGLDRYAKGVAP
jgi:hypothetical protein